MATEDTHHEDKHKQVQSPKYEYLVAVNINETNWAKISDLPSEERPAQTWSEDWYLFWPDKKEYEKRSGKNLSVAALFNELGQKGWRLVSSDIPNSTIPGGDYFGWHETSIPIRQRFIFIREVTS